MNCIISNFPVNSKDILSNVPKVINHRSFRINHQDNVISSPTTTSRKNIQKILNGINLKKYYEFQTNITKINEQKEKLRNLQIEYDAKVSKYRLLVQENQYRYKRTTEYYKSDKQIIKYNHELLTKLSQDIKVLHTKNKAYAAAIEKLKNFDHFIVEAVNILPEDYIKGFKDNQHTAFMRRFYTLYSLNQVMHTNLKNNMNNLVSLIKTQYSLLLQQKTILASHNSAFPELRRELVKLNDEYDDVQHQYSVKYDSLRKKSVYFGQLLQSTNNITNKCIKMLDRGNRDFENLQLSSKLQNMKPDDKFDKIKDSIISAKQILEIVYNPTN